MLTPTCPRHQDGQLGLGPGRPDVFNHDITAIAALSELDLDAPRAARHPPHEHHQPTLPKSGVCQSGNPQGSHLHEHRRCHLISIKWLDSGWTRWVSTRADELIGESVYVLGHAVQPRSPWWPGDGGFLTMCPRTSTRGGCQHVRVLPRSFHAPTQLRLSGLPEGYLLRNARFGDYAASETDLIPKPSRPPQSGNLLSICVPIHVGRPHCGQPSNVKASVTGGQLSHDLSGEPEPALIIGESFVESDDPPSRGCV